MQQSYSSLVPERAHEVRTSCYDESVSQPLSLERLIELTRQRSSHLAIRSGNFMMMCCTRLICSYRTCNRCALKRLPILAEYFDNLVAGRFIVGAGNLGLLPKITATDCPSRGKEARVIQSLDKLIYRTRPYTIL
jgi:hypothetical protein